MTLFSFYNLSLIFNSTTPASFHIHSTAQIHSDSPISAVDLNATSGTCNSKWMNLTHNLILLLRGFSVIKLHHPPPFPYKWQLNAHICTRSAWDQAPLNHHTTLSALLLPFKVLFFPCLNFGSCTSGLLCFAFSSTGSISISPNRFRRMWTLPFFVLFNFCGLCVSLLDLVEIVY